MIDLQEGEQIIDEIRRHWFVIAGKALSLIFAAAIPLFLIFLWPNLAGGGEFGPFISNFTESITLPVVTLLYAVWLWVLWILFFVSWTNYYLDTLLITNKRIVDTEQVSLFHREQSSVPLKKIQDITVETKGIIPSLLNFGDIHIQTAGTQREAVVRDIDNPKEVKQEIMRVYGSETHD